MARSAAHKHDSTRRATYQDVLDAPAHLVAEIINGTLHTPPRPAMPHARATWVLGGKIGDPFDCGPRGPGGWWLSSERELHLDDEDCGPRPRGLAPRAHAGLSRHRLRDARSRLQNLVYFQCRCGTHPRMRG